MIDQVRFVRLFYLRKYPRSVSCSYECHLFVILAKMTNLQESLKKQKRKNAKLKRKLKRALKAKSEKNDMIDQVCFVRLLILRKCPLNHMLVATMGQ